MMEVVGAYIQVTVRCMTCGAHAEVQNDEDEDVDTACQIAMETTLCPQGCSEDDTT